MERIQHLNTEFRTEVKKERYRLNLGLSSRLRASNQNLYEVFQIRPIKANTSVWNKEARMVQYSIILAALFTTKSFASIWRIRQTNTNLF